jgi:CRP/FNR family cyclic AMP-dependent transcriptional regulator
MPLITDDDFINNAAYEVDPKSIDRLLSFCHKRKIIKNTIICREGVHCDELYYILKGSVTVTIADEENRDVILAYLKAGDFIGELGLFYRTKSCNAQVRAKTNCEIAAIGHTTLIGLFETELKEQRGDILQVIGMQLSKRLLHTNRRITRLAYMDVAGRIARTILDMCNEPGALSHPEGTQIHISRKDIGRIAGCTRETVGRVLKQMAEDGMIQVSGMDIVVYHSR